MVLLRKVKHVRHYTASIVQYIGVNSLFYTFALLNVLNWARAVLEFLNNTVYRVVVPARQAI
jgi:hypothetical protein